MGGIVGIGECVVDFIPGDAGDAASLAFSAHPGGSVANLCVVAARMGVESAFVGAVGADAFGEFLRRTLIGFGVNVDGMILSRECGTGLIFVTMGANHEREYTFANVPGADKMLHREQLNDALLEGADVWHFSTNACSCGPTRETQRALMASARGRGKVVSFDVNFRVNNHASVDNARNLIREYAAHADVVKATEEELELLTGKRDAAGAAALLEGNARIVLVTRGGEGVDFYCRSGLGHVAAREVSVVDTTGAGDNFLGGFLTAMLESGGFADVTPERLRRAAAFGNLVSSVSITRWGAMAGVPSRAEVDALL